MEIISIAGYITDEKMHIARDYLEKSTREACGIKPEEVSFCLLEFLCGRLLQHTDMCIYCIYRLYCFVLSVAVLVDLSPENELIYVYKMTIDN